MENITSDYNNLDQVNKNAAHIFLTNRMIHQGVPFKNLNEVEKLLAEWNPIIILKDGLMMSFSEEAQKTIRKIVLDRIAHFRKSK